jgi:hypothetical protein
MNACRYSNTLLVTFNNRTFARGNSKKWDISNSDGYISTSEPSKTLPFSAGLRLDTATEVLTVTYHGNSSRTGFSINTTEESYTFDGDRVNLQVRFRRYLFC